MRRATTLSCPMGLRCRALAALVFVSALFTPWTAHAELPELPWDVGDEVADGWVVSHVQRHREFLRVELRRQDEQAQFEVVYRHPDIPLHTANYSIQRGVDRDAPAEVLDAVHRAALDYESRTELTPAARLGMRSPAIRAIWLERALLVMLLLGLILLATRARALARSLRSLDRMTVVSLLATTAGGALLRLVGGVRVPGFVNTRGAAHGFGYLNELVRSFTPRIDPHGNAYGALYRAVTTVLPATEETIVACQYGFSVATIPLVYAMAAGWFRDRRVGLWAALAYAAMPAVALFATTEVRNVPGAFFGVLAFACTAFAARDEDLRLHAAAACFLVFATQHHPTLMPLPAVWLVACMVTEDGRTLLKRPGGALITALALVLWLLPAVTLLAGATSGSGQGIWGSGLASAWRNRVHLLRPASGFGSNVVHNVFLNRDMTPVGITVLGAVGLVRLRRRSEALLVLAYAAAALGMTMLSLHLGWLILARLQLGAAVFYAVLAGLGAAATEAFISDRIRRPWAGWAALLIVAAVMLVGVPSTLGGMQTRSTAQQERVFFEEALAEVEDGCMVVWTAVREGEYFADVPMYLAASRANDIRWRGLEQTDAALPDAACLYLYRPAACWVLDEQAPAPEGTMRSECVRFERGLGLQPVRMRSLRPPDGDNATYHRPVEVGLFRVTDRGARR